MNARTVTILWAIAVALGIAVAAVKLTQKQATDTATKRSPGQNLFEAFPAADVSTIRITGADGSTTLEKKDGKWTVAERDGYPANASYANEFIRTLSELKITQAMEAGPSFAARFGMDESAKKSEDRGLTAIFLDSSNKEIAKISLGKNLESASSGGRFIRDHTDESGFYAISEMFPAVSTEPQRWLADGFISLEKIKSITVKKAGQDQPEWKASRDSETAEFTLEGLAAGEKLDPAVATQLKSLMAYARFEDVTPAAALALRKVTDQERNVTIESFEGFTYQFTISPAKATETPTEDSDNPMPPADDNQLLTVTVSAELPTERKKEEGETEEDAKAKDTAFTERLKTLTEKLEKEKAFAGRTFEVSKSLVESLLKQRAELIQKEEPAAPTPPATTATSPPIEAVTPPIEAVTPPISIPPAEEE